MCKEKGFLFPLNVSMETKTNNIFQAIKKKPKNKSKPETLNFSLEFHLVKLKNIKSWGLADFFACSVLLCFSTPQFFCGSTSQ